MRGGLLVKGQTLHARSDPRLSGRAYLATVAARNKTLETMVDLHRPQHTVQTRSNPAGLHAKRERSSKMCSLAGCPSRSDAWPGPSQEKLSSKSSCPSALRVAAPRPLFLAPRCLDLPFRRVEGRGRKRRGGEGCGGSGVSSQKRGLPSTRVSLDFSPWVVKTRSFRKLSSPLLRGEKGVVQGGAGPCHPSERQPKSSVTVLFPNPLTQTAQSGSGQHLGGGLCADASVRQTSGKRKTW